MNLPAPHRLLWDALALPLPQARDAWQCWRESIDLDRLDAASFHLLPALSGRLTDWLATDARQAILLGICRRAWSQNQFRKRLLADALEILRGAGIERVAATGPVLWADLYWPEGAIRHIGNIELLVEPDSVQALFETLKSAGWTAPHGIPDTTGNEFYFEPAMPLQSPSGGYIRVHWRTLPHTDLSLRRPPSPVLERLPQGQVAPYAPPAEHSLVAALGGLHQDEVAWQYDALMIGRHPGLRWEIVAELLPHRSKARERLDELRREWGADIPSAVTKPLWTSGGERLLASALRVYRRAVHG